MKLKGIELSWIVVKDLQEAIKFYTEIVGLSLKNLDSKYGWAELSGPEGAGLGIAQDSPQSEIPPGSNAVVTFTVERMEEARERFLEKGAKLIGEVIEVPGHVKLQTFQDSDGNTFQLVEKL